MSFECVWQDVFAEACNEATMHFMQTDKVYNREVKRRAKLSPVIEMLVEHEGDIHLTEEQRKNVAEYLALLTGQKELETLIICYVRGMRDCVKLLRQLDVLKEK